MKFRTWAILWLFALLASALATFGAAGVVVAMAVLTFWTVVFEWNELPALLKLSLLAITLVFLAFALPAFEVARESSRSLACRNQLRCVGLALESYERDYGRLPPAYLTSSEGQPLLSWRVLLLPKLEQKAVLDRLNTAEAWNSDSNSPHTDASNECFCCPSNPDSLENAASYFAVVGPATAWPGRRGRMLNEITDEPSRTILVIEVPSRGIRWAEPKDLSFEEAVHVLMQPPTNKDGSGHPFPERFFYKPDYCRHVLFADGNVRTLKGPLRRELAVALLTARGGEYIDASEFESICNPELNYARIYSLSVFLVLSLLPVVKLRRKPPMVDADD